MDQNTRYAFTAIALGILYLLWTAECNHRDGYRPSATPKPPRWRVGPMGTKIPLFSVESGAYHRPLPATAVPQGVAAALQGGEGARHLRGVELM